MKFYGLKNCDTCRKALKALEAAGVDCAYHDVRKDGVSTELAHRWITAAGAERVLNKRGTTWRSLSDADKARAEDDTSLAALFSEHPALIKRPVIEQGDEISVGWTKDIQEKYLG